MAKCFAPYGWPPQESGSSYKGPLGGGGPSTTTFFVHGPSSVSSSSTSTGFGEAEAAAGVATAASKIHSLAEKRRRERINAHHSTLRRMLPNSSKLDKAALLGKVIDQVKDLERKASEISKDFPIPKEVNEVTVQCEGLTTDDDQEENVMIKASVCCEDRPDLFADLVEAFRGLGLRAVRADMASLGGRVRNVFLLCRESSGEVSLSSMVESVREELGRVASMDLASTEISGKRQRLLQLHCSYDHLTSGFD